MAYKRIEGITIEIDGNVEPLNKALQGVNKSIKDVSQNLRDVDKLLKLDPTNTELLRQKQQGLRTAIQETEEKLKTERTALQQLKDADQTPEVVKQQEALQREIIDNEQKLKSLQSELKSFGSVGAQQIKAIGAQMKELGASIKSVGDSMQATGRSMTMKVTAPILAGFGAAVKEGAEFDKQMSAVAAVSGATAEDFENLRDSAMEWGEKSVFSAKESADALYYMGLAGWDAQESMDALGGVLDLAAAGATELGTASDIVTDYMTAFKMEASEAGHFANVMAAAMSNSNTNIEMLGDSFKYVAPVAGAMGYSVEDISVALGIMANNGIKADMAGTTLRNMLQRMAKPTKESYMAMERLGLSLYDDEGRMYTFKEVMEQVRTGFRDINMPMDEFQKSVEDLDRWLDEGSISQSLYNSRLEELMLRAYGAEGAEKARAAAQLGGARAMAGLLAIASATDEEYQALTDAINGADAAFVRHGDELLTIQEAYDQFGDAIYNSDEFEVLGAAAGMAEKQLNNLAGSWTLFTSKLGTTKIMISDLVKGELQGLVEKATGLLDKFNSLDDAEKMQIVKIAGIAAAIGPVILILGTLASSIGSIISLGGTIVSGFGTVAGFFSATLIPALSGLPALITGTMIPAITGLIATVAPILAAAAPFIAVGAAIVGAGVLVYKNWDTIKQKAGELKDKVTQKWSEFKENTTKKWEEMRQKTSEKWEAMKKGISDKVAENGGGIGGVIKTAMQGYQKTWEIGFNALDKLSGGKLSTIASNIKSKVDENGGGIGGIIKTSMQGYEKVWETGFNALDKITGGKLSDIVDGFRDKLDSAKKIVSDAIEKIKGFFDFSWELPKLKLPHFSISGEFSLMPPSIPHISVDWYKKAYNNGVMFNSPTVLPTAAGLKGFGDGAGAEIVIGANNLMGMVQDAAGSDALAKKVDTLTATVAEYLPIIAQGGNVYLDKGALVGQITPDINRRLGLARG